MRYLPQSYAHAFVDAALKEKGAEHDRLIRNLLALVKKNGQARMLPKILAEVEKRLLKKSGLRKIVFSAARPQKAPLAEKFRHLVLPTDIVREEIRPPLIAGVKISINDELEFDGSLQRKITKLFTSTNN